MSLEKPFWHLVWNSASLFLLFNSNIGKNIKITQHYTCIKIVEFLVTYIKI